jgi:polysaccharide biosynthesis/export protein
MKYLIGTILFLLLIASLPSCRFVYPNLMFKQKDYQYFELAKKEVAQYLIQSGDELTLQIYSRDGFKLIDVIGGSSVVTGQSSSTYAVDEEGFARFPVLGDFYVKGFTESELQRVLEEKFSGLFIDPYINLTVANRRVFIFRGSSASIISLRRTPTSLFEVLSSAGGITGQLKAYKIKIIRGDLKNPEVHLVDLSTLEGIRKTDLIVQGNDIIYLEEKKNVPSDVLNTVMPYVSVLTTISALIVLATTIGTR